MAAEQDADVMIYSVVVNDEEQYSIWRKDDQVPRGWRKIGKDGLREDCLKYIDEIWTDMRPLSLRRRMDSSPSQ